MKRINWKALIPHAIAIAIFLIIALVYCKPALEGKVLQQHDVTQWKGMAQNSFQYKEKHGHFPLWTNGMFSGMPAYQITGIGNNPVSVGYIGHVLNLGLPKPAGVFFLACLCFYFLTQVLRVNPYIGIVGALGYAYATYNPIILAAGHDTKMNAIAYLPFIIGSLLLIYERKYIWGAALTALSTALLLGANHLQITYYAVLIILIMSIAFAISCIRQKDYKHLIQSAGIAVIAGLLGILVNATTLFTTYEYSKRTIRGGSVLADGKTSATKTGLSTDYALSYSVYKTEPLVMMFPRIYGGSSNNMEIAEEKSKALEALQQMPQQLAQQLQGAMQFYWGGIDGVGTSGPPYAGAIICFLALIGFVVVDKKYTYWIAAAAALTIMMSWGKYFEGFNLAMLKFLPFYNKFRAPSMILVVPTFLFAMLATLALQKIITDQNKELLWKQYKKGLLVVAGVFAIAALVYFSSDFSAEADRSLLQQVNSIPDATQREAVLAPVKQFVTGLQEDRKSLFLGDLLRTFLFCAVAAGALYAAIKTKISSLAVIAVIGVFALIDVFSINSKYLNSNNYQDAAEYEGNFTPSPADTQILQDTGYYRVLNLSQGISNAFNGGALTAYFHKSIGGYHPAKLSIYQDLIERQLYNFPNCLPVLNMLNTKYLIMPDQQTGQPVVQQNTNALGAAWFVKGIRFEKGPAEVMNALTYFYPKDTAVVEEKYRSVLQTGSATDSAATISLVYNDNDRILYNSSSAATQFAVFSEVFYDAGWVATIDGKEAPVIQANYVLRGLVIPAGKHQIEFNFKPASYKTGNMAATISSVAIWLLLILAVAGNLRKNKTA
ncbi:MAG: YfhO family protein [Sphingobacteriia bacterium]|nr:YfhO family protein [Sphingobacteriia bacterium]